MEYIMEFSINRSLCELEFDRELKSIDVDVMEYVWFKIRESFVKKELSSSITIKFTELSKNIGKYHYQNESLTESFNRLNKIHFTTNTKQNSNQKKFSFNFENYVKDERTTKNKLKLRDVLSDMFDTFERVEKDGDIHLKSDREKIDFLKDTIQSMIKQNDREKIIKGES